MRSLFIALMIFIIQPSHASTPQARHACTILEAFANQAALDRYAGVPMSEHFSVINSQQLPDNIKWILKKVTKGAHDLGNAERLGFQIALSREYAEEVYIRCLRMWKRGKAYEW